MSAVRIGNRVELEWTGPARTTDGLDLTQPKPVATTVEICRDVLPENETGKNWNLTCTAVRQTVGHPGASAASDALPADLTQGSARGTTLMYRVRILNGSGRSAPPSNRVLVPAGPPVAPVQDFRAVPARDGVVLEWRAEQRGAVEILRTLVAAPAGAKPSKPLLGEHGSGSNASVPVRLRGSPGDTNEAVSVSGRAGMRDTSALLDATYIYRAERVETLVTHGMKVALHSEPTPPMQVAVLDTFPPLAPAGLVSVARLDQPSNGAARPTIDLSWQPNTEVDLAGYFVYRRDLGPATSQASPVRLTRAPLPGPAYRDETVAVGERYEYSISAVDRRGNESRRGEPLTEMVAKLP